jgi:hypothetical protein
MDDHPEVMLVSVQIFVWVAFFLSTTRTWNATSVGAVIFSVLLLALMAFVIGSQAIRGTASLQHIAVSALTMLSLVLVNASIVYYSIGGRHNWNVRLSHVNALLVSVGTLTTAGTAGITPRSELARGLLVGQMVIDFAVVTVVIGLVLQRLATRQPAPVEPDKP